MADKRKKESEKKNEKQKKSNHLIELQFASHACMQKAA